MKNIFKTKGWLLGLTALLSINSCQHESMGPAAIEGVSALSRAEDISDGGLLAKLRQGSLQNWEDFKAALPDYLVERDGKVFLKEGLEKSSEGDCFCGYEIIEVVLEHPPGYPNTFFEFFANASCLPHSPCKYFHAGYSDDPNFNCFSSPFPNCTDFLNPPSFTGIYTFKCGTPLYSVFPVEFFFLPLSNNPDCASVGLAPLSGAIRFKIHCSGEYYADNNCDRPTGAWVLYSSDVMSLEIVNGQFMSPSNTLVMMSGCGCLPILASPL